MYFARLISTAFLAICCLAEHADATDTLETSSVAGWSIAALPFDGSRNFSHCAASTQASPNTYVLFGITRTFAWNIGLVHKQWAMSPGTKSMVSYYLDDGPRQHSEAMVVGSDHLVILLQDSIEQFRLFRRARTLKFETSQGTLIPFDLTNSSKALDATLACARKWTTNSAQPAQPQQATQNVYVPPADLRDVAAKFLAGAGITDYKFLQVGANDIEIAWEYSDGMMGTLSIVRADAKMAMERVLALTIERDTQYCKGRYSSGYMPAKYHVGSEIRRLYTACADGGRSFAYYYSIVQVPSGAFVRFGSNTKVLPDGSAAQDSEALPRADRVEDAGLRVISARP